MRDGMLEFKDAPMFGRVMRDPEICRGVLERFLGFEIGRIEYLNAEHAFDPATDAKGVRLDVFAKGSGRVFDIEMQVAHDPELGRRLRYYQASVDQASLDKGSNYAALDESFIIFVCDFDPYGRDVSTYHLERTCVEDNTVMIEDGSHWLVLNAAAWERETNPQRRGMLQYLHRSDIIDDALVQRIDASVQKANADREWRKNAVGFMTLEHHHRAQMYGARKEGLEEGLRQGLEQGREEGKGQGRKEEAARYSTLIDALLDAGRIDDLKRAAEDDAFRESLFVDFHIA